ncbi:hypothetical protein KIW84_013878 [Lathyrus oleraceus]|uniref:Uncharacterized protein n=1 Tax=Pisum sativum TaxID=3888 RepID=A0A9D5BLH5_PEA|nr:hypothetical protein KIW84_013878 [Pisum sativum]
MGKDLAATLSNFFTQRKNPSRHSPSIRLHPPPSLHEIFTLQLPLPHTVPHLTNLHSTKPSLSKTSSSSSTPSSPSNHHISLTKNPPSTFSRSLRLLLSLATFLFFRPFQGNRCLNSNPRSVKVVWEHSTAAGTRDLPNRHKVRGFVGIQTGFGSGRRRESLREMWFPSDQHGLQRLEESMGLAFRFCYWRNK